MKKTIINIIIVLLTIVLCIMAKATNYSTVTYNTTNYGYIIFSSDDASRSMYTNISKAMNDYGIIGTYNIITDYVPVSCGSTHLCQQELKIMASQGHEIGSHTQNLSDNTQIQTLQQLTYNLNQSNMFGLTLGIIIQTFAYPLGLIEGYIRPAVTKIAYTTAQSTAYSNSKTANTNVLNEQDVIYPYSYPRKGIDDSVPFEEESTFYAMANYSNFTKGFTRFYIHEISTNNEDNYFRRLLNYSKVIGLKSITEKDAWAISVERIINSGQVNSSIIIGKGENLTINLEPFKGQFNITFNGYHAENLGYNGGLEFGTLSGWTYATVANTTISTTTQAYEGSYALNITNKNIDNSITVYWNSIRLSGTNSNKIVYCSAKIKVIKQGNYVNNEAYWYINQYNTSSAYCGDTGKLYINETTNEWHTIRRAVDLVRNPNILRLNFGITKNTNASILLDNVLCTLNTTDIYTNYIGRNEELTTGTEPEYTGNLTASNGINTENGNAEYGNITYWEKLLGNRGTGQEFNISNTTNGGQSYNGQYSITMNNTNTTSNFSLAWKAINLEGNYSHNITICSFKIKVTPINYDLNTTDGLIWWGINMFNTTNGFKQSIGRQWITIPTNTWETITYAVNVDFDSADRIYPYITLNAGTNLTAYIDDMICTFNQTGIILTEEPTEPPNQINLTINGEDIQNGSRLYDGQRKYNVTLTNANRSGLVEIKIIGATNDTVNYNAYGGMVGWLRDELNSGIELRRYPIYLNATNKTINILKDYDYINRIYMFNVTGLTNAYIIYSNSSTLMLNGSNQTININLNSNDYIIIHDESTCIPPTINNDWKVDFNNECKITNPVNLGSGSLIIQGTGLLSFYNTLKTSGVNITCNSFPCVLSFTNDSKLIMTKT